MIVMVSFPTAVLVSHIQTVLKSVHHVLPSKHNHSHSLQKMLLIILHGMLGIYKLNVRQSFWFILTWSDLVGLRDSKGNSFVSLKSNMMPFKFLKVVSTYSMCTCLNITAEYKPSLLIIFCSLLCVMSITLCSDLSPALLHTNCLQEVNCYFLYN